MRFIQCASTARILVRLISAVFRYHSTVSFCVCVPLKVSDLISFAFIHRHWKRRIACHIRCSNIYNRRYRQWIKLAHSFIADVDDAAKNALEYGILIWPMLVHCVPVSLFSPHSAHFAILFVIHLHGRFRHFMAHFYAIEKWSIPGRMRIVSAGDMACVIVIVCSAYTVYERT